MKKEKFPKQKKIVPTGETKLHKTMTFAISFWATVEQIRSKQGLDTPDQAIEVSVMKLAQRLGIEA